MKRQVRTQQLGGARAMILHRPHLNVQALTRQLRAIGLVVDEAWPELGPAALAADFVFFDADMGHDGMFPWPEGQPPMPMIATWLAFSFACPAPPNWGRMIWRA